MRYGTVDAYERVDAGAADGRRASGARRHLRERRSGNDPDGGDRWRRAGAQAPPGRRIRLTPIYTDALAGNIGTVIFRREGGRVTALSVVQDRVWDLRFTIKSARGSTAARYRRQDADRTIRAERNVQRRR